MPDTSPQHPLDQAVAFTDIAPGRLAGTTHPAYWNVVGPYGGVIASMVIAAIQRQPQVLGEPLSLTVNYAGPIHEGAYEIEVRAMRTNRTTQHWLVTILQGENRHIVTTATAVFAVRRPVWSQQAAQMPPAPAPDGVASFALRGMRWAERYQMRVVQGMPMQANPDNRSIVWIADLPPRPLDFVSLAAICDTFSPRLFLVRPTVAPVATVSMTIYFHADAQRLARQGSAPVLTDATGNTCHEGYYDHEGRVWASDGQLLASTQQIAWYRE